MTDSLQGQLDAGPLRFGIILSRFNQIVGNRLLEGAIDALTRHGADPSRLEVIRVPGSFEVPAVAQRLARSGQYDALICLGTLIRGETAHFDALNHQVTRGLSEVARTPGVPVGFGIVTTDSLEQALERAGGKMGNRGADAAVAAIESANLFRRLRERD